MQLFKKRKHFNVAVFAVLLLTLPVVGYYFTIKSEEEIIVYARGIIGKEQYVNKLIAQSDSIWGLFSGDTVKSIYIETSTKNKLIHYSIRSVHGKNDTSFNLTIDPSLREISSPYIGSKYSYNKKHLLFYNIGFGKNGSSYHLILILESTLPEKEKYIYSKFKKVDKLTELGKNWYLIKVQD